MCTHPMFQLSGAVTLDDETPDDFLTTTRQRYQQIAANRLFLHADQTAAVSRSMASAGEANIVGHGNRGVICTGCGPFLNRRPTERIELGNIGNWMPSGMTKLTLLGCNTGLGDRGAQLLFAIAHATGATVSAPTGYVYIGGGCDDFFLEPGTGFQTAVPGTQPQPITDDLPLQFALDHLMLTSGPVLAAIDVADVTSVRLHEPGPIDPDRRPIARWDGADGVAAIGHIDFTRPMQRGFPAAIETGRLVVHLRTPGIEQPSRTFRIFNDNQLQDMEQLGVQYRANIEALRVTL